MFHADEVTTKSLDKISGQLNDWLGEVITTGLLDNNDDLPLEKFANDSDAGSSSFFNADFTFAESFTVYSLDQEKIEASDSLRRDLSKLVRETDRRHHQLRVNQRPVAYARSIISKGDYVTQLFVSSLARAVEDAIAWIDDYEKRNPEQADGKSLVRLLTVPAHNVVAFWILKQTSGRPTKDELESAVLIISAPERMGMKRKRLLNTRQFLEALKQKPAIKGLG